MERKNITNVKVKCVDLKTDMVKDVDVLLDGKLTEFPSIRKLSSVLDTEEVAPVKVVSMDHTETLYGMEEDFFYTNAVMLDPKTRKPMVVDQQDLDTFNVAPKDNE